MQYLLAFHYLQKLYLFRKYQSFWIQFYTYELRERNRKLFIKPKLKEDNIGINYRLTEIKFWYDGSIQGGSAYLLDSYKFICS